MRVCTATLKSVSPYSQSKATDTPRRDRETASDHEERVWRERLHVDESGQVIIPPMAFKNSLSEIAKFLGKQIPGKGKSTYTKHFEAGVMVLEATPLGINKDDVVKERLFVPSDGIRGSGKRVWKNFPLIPEWAGKVVFYVLDETITPEVFEQHLRDAGLFIGIGRFRPRNNGFYGRFSVVGTEWAEQ